MIERQNLEQFRPVPVDEDALKTAMEAFHCLDCGAQTGEWDAFLELLHEELTWFAPVDGFQGLHHNKASIEKLFRHHASVTRTHWQLKNIVANGNEIGFESWTTGTMENKSYGNQLLMLFVIEEGKVKHIREYAGYHNGIGDFVGHGNPNDGADAYAYKGL
ncbi:nuclear transport factor 2 family protein [Myxosarcina sp. GI1]|uniref:nuclear transport factor 2 family protein n=1 Tax=Myxosarcina sp. GI1 TaxID=1541065 RepID=UPI00056C8822|nr:nuclear transport factor 2 family protein [Myxosarcina sp. GI1]